jgi:NADH dehydrogenase/NADH:ubiquinone oxidoreductase subunit G
MSESSHQCDYCNRRFKHRDLHTQHQTTCALLHQDRQAFERSVDAHETEDALPSAQELFKLVQRLILQNTKLETRIAKLESTVHRHRKKMLLEWLNQSSNTAPAYTFSEWSSLKPISNEIVEHACKHGLTEGIKLYVKNLIAFSKESNVVLPICSFVQKRGQLYSYDLDEPSGLELYWSPVSQERFSRWVDTLSCNFLKAFIGWQRLRDWTVSEDTKQENVENMRNINDVVHEQRRKTELKKWLCEVLEQPAIYEVV